MVDANGFDPRGVYFERYWLGVVGPTATLIMRRFADLLDEQPSGCVVNLEHSAHTMGLSFNNGARSPFGRALQRCVMFGLARQLSGVLMVRRRVPQVAQRHLARLPDDVRDAHDDYVGAAARIDRRDLSQRLRDAGISPKVCGRLADRVC